MGETRNCLLRLRTSNSALRAVPGMQEAHHKGFLLCLPEAQLHNEYCQLLVGTAGTLSLARPWNATNKPQFLW